MKYIVVIVFLIISLCVFPASVVSPDTDSIALAAEGDSVTLIFTVNPPEACQDAVWTLSLIEDKMTSWLCRRVKEKLEDGVVYIELEPDGFLCVVTAKQYFKYGIKYKTYWRLTATSVADNNFSATCDITLG
ncbi:MAG: hypothetical protein ACI4VW_00465 [Acutalibacteraceae bacterium]